MSVERTYSPEDLSVAYTKHVIVEVETLGGLRTIGNVVIALEHDERLFACRGNVTAYGADARLWFWRARGWRVGELRPSLRGDEILYEPKSDSLIIPASHSTTGRPLVVVSVGDVLAIVSRKESPPLEGAAHAESL